MKKTISILSILLISLFLFNAFSQNTNIIGSWSGKTSHASDNPKDSMKGIINYDYTFNADFLGEVFFYGDVEGAVDKEFYLKLKIKGSCPFTWTKKDNIISITSNQSQLSVDLSEKDVDLICSDSEMQSIINSYKPYLIKMMRRKFKSSLKSSISKTEWKIIKCEGNTLTINENGNTLKLTRK